MARVALSRWKVCHLTSAHSALDVRILQKECASLAKEGYAVFLVAQHPRDEILYQTHIISIPKPRGRLWRMVVTTCQAFLAGLRLNADIYHVHDPELLFWGQILKLMRRRVIYDMHENVPQQILIKPWIHPLIRRLASVLFRVAQRTLMAGLPTIFAETSYAKDYGWLKRSIIVRNMPLADDLSQIHEPKHETPTIGYIGAVSAVRGSLNTLEALHLLDQSGLTLAWECVGTTFPPQHAVELREKAEFYMLDGVRIYGYLPPQQGWRVIARCHIGLAVLQAADNYRESYPTKLFEYMGLGLPVIASDFPLYSEIVANSRCGLSISPDDPVALADAIKWLIEHPQEATAMGQTGKKMVIERYNWAIEAKKMLEFYDHIQQS